MAERFPIIGDLIDFFLAKEAAEEQKNITDKFGKKIGNLKNYEFSDRELQPYFQDIPDDVKYELVKSDPEMRAKQLAALEKMQSIADGRAESQGEAQRELARMRAEQLAQSQQEGIQQQMASRGVGGSGLEFALKGQSGQQAANRAYMGGLQSAAQGALERMQSQQAYQQGLGNLRAQDTDLSARNSDIINRFNAYNADRQLAAQNANTGMKNQFQMYNRQRGDRNEMATKDFEVNRLKTYMSMIPDQRADVARYYQPMFNINDAWSRAMGQMLAMGVGGGMGGDIGGGLGGGMGQMAGQAAGTKMAGQAMESPSYYQQQGGYNQPVPTGQYMKPEWMYSSGGYG